MRLLFSSIHGDLEPSGGAALCTREMLEMLASRGMECRAFTAGALDHERETATDEVLAGLGLPVMRVVAERGEGRRAEVVDLTANRVRVTLLPTASSRAERPPDRHESAVFLRRRGGCPSGSDRRAADLRRAPRVSGLRRMAMMAMATDNGDGHASWMAMATHLGWRRPDGDGDGHESNLDDMGDKRRSMFGVAPPLNLPGNFNCPFGCVANVAHGQRLDADPEHEPGKPKTRSDSEPVTPEPVRVLNLTSS